MQANDTFTRADAANLGSNYQYSFANAFEVISNRAVPATTSTHAAQWTTAAATTAQFSSFQYAATPAGVSVFVGPAIHMPTFTGSGGLAAQGDFYVFTNSAIDKRSIAIRRKDNLASTLTTLDAVINLPTGLVGGEVMELAREGADLVGYIDGVEVIRRAVSLAPLVAGGNKVGFYSTGNAGVAIDNFLAGDISSGRSGTGTASGTGALTSVGAGGIVSSGANFSVTENTVGQMQGISKAPNNVTAKAGSWQFVSGDFNLVTLLSSATNPTATFTAPAA